MQVNDDVLHLGIVYRTLRTGTPSVFSRGVIAKYANEIESGKITEFKGAGVRDPSTHDEV